MSASKATERKIVNIRLDADLWCRAKSKAALSGMTLQEWVEAALAKKLSTADSTGPS